MRRAWLTIYKKELVDTLRDRRTLATMLIVPMVVYPLTLLFTTETLAVHQKEGETREVKVIASTALPAGAIAALQASRALRVETATLAATSTAARAALSGKDADVAVVAEPSLEDALHRDASGEITIYFDATKSFADTAVRRTSRALERFALELRDARMIAHGLPISTATPLAIEARSISSNEQVGNQIAGVSLPALLLVFIALSSFYPAVDLTAGEKERKTLATLLTAPVRPIDVVLGKYFAVVTVGTLAGLLNVIVLALTLLRVVSTSAEANSAFAFSIPIVPILILSPLITLISLPIGALMLLVAALARSFRDASYLLTPVLLAAIAPASIASLPGFELTPRIAAIPFANAALLMKALLMEKAAIEPALIVVVSSLAFTALLLFLCARVFSDERVLFSTSGRRADLAGLVRRPPPPSASTGLVLASVIFVTNYYGGFFAGGRTAIEAVAFTQIAAHLLPAGLLALWMRRSIPPQELLRLHRPSLRALVSGLAIGAGAWLGLSIPAAWLTSYLIPGQSEAARAFAEMLGLERLTAPAALLAFALAPAAFEELAFRGALLGLLERTLRPGSAVLSQAVLFGLMHGSIFRFLPTALLGLLLGVLAQRTRSVWPGMCAHAMTNGVLITLEMRGPESIARTLEAPTPIALVGLALVALGLFALKRTAGAPSR
jgi:sodium transport system permease protein